MCLFAIIMFLFGLTFSLPRASEGTGCPHVWSVCLTVYGCFWLVVIIVRVLLLITGIGIGYIVVNALVCIYYNVIIAISIYYLFASFTTELPWASCGHEWNTAACGDPGSGELPSSD